MKRKHLFFLLILAVATTLASCSNNESYADRLNNERNATNAFLRNYRVINDIPEDSVFETGDNAPFYRIDPEGNVYMQVLNAGNHKTDAATTSMPVYFRYTRYNIQQWYSTGQLVAYSDNATDNMSAYSAYFNYDDFTLPVSSQWGYGIQMPLDYLGVEDSEVWLLVKSQYGILNEIGYVQPFLYHIRYFHSMI